MKILIPVIENLLTEVIESKMKELKADLNIIDKLFKHVPLVMRNRLREFIYGGKIKVIRGIPMDKASIPCYAIMLGGEREQEKVIGSSLNGDAIGYDYDVIIKDVDLNVSKKDGILIAQVPSKPIEVINSVTNSDGLPLDFEVLNPNLGLIGLNETEVSFGDSIKINYGYRDKGVEQYGTFFNSQFRIETWTNNGDLTILLYYLLKWMLLSSRDSLEDSGIALQTLGGLDLNQSPEYLPELVYIRALTFECTSENSFDVQFDFIQDIIAERNEEE